MSRRVTIVVVLLLLIGACGDDTTIERDPTGSVDQPDATVTTEVQDPFETAVEVVLGLPADDIFALLDSLDDAEYFALIDSVGVAGDVEFVEALDSAKAAELVDAIDDGLYADLLALAESGLDPTAGSPVTSVAPDPEPSPGSNAAADVRRIDGGALGRKGRVFVEVGPGDISFLAFARTGDPDAQVFITSVVSPSGVDVGDAIGLEYGELSNFGEAAFYAPIKEQVDLEFGEYAVAFEATDEIVASGAL